MHKKNTSKDCDKRDSNNNNDNNDDNYDNDDDYDDDFIYESTAFSITTDWGHLKYVKVMSTTMK